MKKKVSTAFKKLIFCNIKCLSLYSKFANNYDIRKKKVNFAFFLTTYLCRRNYETQKRKFGGKTLANFSTQFYRSNRTCS